IRFIFYSTESCKPRRGAASARPFSPAGSGSENVARIVPGEMARDEVPIVRALELRRLGRAARRGARATRAERAAGPVRVVGLDGPGTMPGRAHPGRTCGARRGEQRGGIRMRGAPVHGFD